MLDLIVIALTSLLALIGATMNTHAKATGEHEPMFKRPTVAGGAVVAFILALCIFQFLVKRQQLDKQARQRLEDSVRTGELLSRAEAHSQQLTAEKRLLQTTYDSQLKTLTNTSSLIGRSKAIQDSIARQFATTADRFQTLLAQSASLLRPVRPMVVRFRIILPFHNSLLREWVNRTTAIRDSLRADPRRQHYGIMSIGLEPHKAGDDPAMGEELIYASIDTSSSLYLRPGIDGAGASLLNPTFQVQVFSSMPSPDRITPPPILMLEAQELAPRPDPASPFSRFPMEINFRDSTVTLTLYYRMKPIATRTAVMGITDLAGKYISVYSFVANNDHQLESIVLLTGPSFAHATLLAFQPEHAVRPPNGLLEYVRRIDSAEVR